LPPLRLALLLLAFALLPGCGGTRRDEARDPVPRGRVAVGHASWYGERFRGRPTASGDVFDPRALTAAHRTLPLGAVVRVTNLQNGRSALARINDRGPYVEGRILDCSEGLARALGFRARGLTRVAIDWPEGRAPAGLSSTGR
jgi:rare lipoprotein A